MNRRHHLAGAFVRPTGVILLGAITALGCGSADAPSPEESLGMAEEGLTCVTLQRTGVARGPSQDAEIITDPSDPTKASTNYGAVAQMNTGYVGTNYRRILMQFDLGSIPAGSTLGSATLTVRMIQSPGKAAVNLHEVMIPWSESTVTWNAIGSAFDPVPEATFATLGVPNNSQVDVDLTGLASRWLSGATPNNGFLFDHPASGRTAIGSTEAPTVGPRPKLVVCYVAPTCNDGIQNGAETGVDCGGTCAPCSLCAGVTCAPADACHLAGTCDPATGLCNSAAVPDGTSCNDGLACSAADTCQSGTCVAGPVPAGGGSVDIHQAAVNTSIGVTDGFFGQTFTPTVSGYLTQLVVPVSQTFGRTTATLSLHPGGACTPNPCNAAVYSEVFPFAAGANTFVLSTPVAVTAGQEYAWRIVSGSQINSDLGNNNPYPGGRALVFDGYDLPFTTYVRTCPWDCSSPMAPEGGACDDGNACTETDTCQSGTCIGVDPVLCGAPDACHAAGSCDPATGACSSPALPDGTECSDANACTLGDVCMAGVCSGVANNAMYADVSQTSSNTSGGFGADFFGESFTPVTSGYLARLDVPVTGTFGATTVTLTIHPGGVCGSIYPCNAATYTEVFPFAAGTNSFVLSSPVALSAGQQYLWKLSSGTQINANISSNDVYPGGVALAYSGYDMLFTTYMTACK